MAKTFPIMIEVEEIALGPVLRKLNDMPGIAKLHLDLGHGGQGAGQKQLADATAARSGNTEATILKFLLDGPKSVGAISAVVGGARSRTYTALTTMRKKGLTEAGDGAAMHQLTAAARAQLGQKALPAPAATSVAKAPSGRAAQGAGNIVLANALADGPKTPGELRKAVAEAGMSPKSVSGVLERAKRHGLIKKNGIGYELTAKGAKIETGAAQHG
ncbi:MAG TPA: hypothetical protein VM867_08340 [Xanthobacteraceae bacterium]|nr:hypothetical protein [Xanthobacteraceae bacterium]